MPIWWPINNQRLPAPLLRLIPLGTVALSKNLTFIPLFFTISLSSGPDHPPPPFVLFPLLWKGTDSWGSHWSLNFLHGWPMTSLYTHWQYLFTSVNKLWHWKQSEISSAWKNIREWKVFVSFWLFFIHSCNFILNVRFGDFFKRNWNASNNNNK